CRAQHALSAVTRVRGRRGTKFAGEDTRTRDASIPSAAPRCRGPALLPTKRGGGESPAPARETGMADQDMRTYKLIELVGTSPTSYAEATKNAVERAGETLRGLGWFEVTELRGLLEKI